MSRIGKLPISIPSGVEIKKDDKSHVVTVKGPLGELHQYVDPDITLEVEDGHLKLTRPTDQKRHKALHGLYRALLNNMVTDLDEGRPVFARMQNAKFTLANFMRTHLLSALATLKIGLDILTQTEQVAIDKLYGHGGFFKTPEVGQRMLSAAVGAPVSVMETAGEGGPYGMALLAAYMLWKDEGESLPDYLDHKVFADAKSATLMAEESDIAGFNTFLIRYRKALPVEKAATELL